MLLLVADRYRVTDEVRHRRRSVTRTHQLKRGRADRTKESPSAPSTGPGVGPCSPHPARRASPGRLSGPTVAHRIFQRPGGIGAWIPELPNADRITLAMLLGHTSGLGDWDPVVTVLEDLTRSFTPEEVLAEAVAAPPYGEPGERFAYTNGGYAATGLIIERVLGEPLGAVVEKRVTGPLSLDDTRLGDGSTKPTRHGWFSLPPTTPTRTDRSTPSTSPTRRT